MYGVVSRSYALNSILSADNDAEEATAYREYFSRAQYAFAVA